MNLEKFRTDTKNRYYKHAARAGFIARLDLASWYQSPRLEDEGICALSSLAQT